MTLFVLSRDLALSPKMDRTCFLGNQEAHSTVEAFIRIMFLE